LGERRQGRDGICLFHISTTIESLTPGQGHFNNLRNNHVSMTCGKRMRAAFRLGN
jgi:hypothetical protein